MLGGSSGINNQAFIAPSAAGIDAWSAMGNSGWDWKTLAPYYRKFHTLKLPNESTAAHLGLDYANVEVNGTDGPIQASYTGVVLDPLSKAWVDTFKAIRYGVRSDPFSGKALGGYANPSTVDPKTKTRSYSASAYYAPADQRPNLHVFVGAEVENIGLVSQPDQDVLADHVNFVIDGTIKSINARKEVILAAGVFQSPKLLELSGIGNPEILESISVPTLIPNRNVGENLQDHLMAGISYEVQPGVMTGDPLMRQEPEQVEAAMKIYSNNLGGPLAVGGIGSHAIMPLLDLDRATGRSSELQALLEANAPSSDDKLHYDFLRTILEAPEEGVGALFMFAAQWNLNGGSLRPENFLTLGAIQSHPFSRGSSHAISKIPADQPSINPKYFSNPVDLELLAHHVLFLEQFANTSPLSTFLKPDGKRNSPAAHLHDLQAAKDYIKDIAVSTYHPCGTCAMLPRADGGVVSDHLLVHGTKNLRVVDASVFPIIPRGNIQSTVYAVAERAADIIKAEG